MEISYSEHLLEKARTKAADDIQSLDISRNYVYEETKEYDFDELIKLPLSEIEAIRSQKENESFVIQSIYRILALQELTKVNINKINDKGTNWLSIVIWLSIAIGIGGYAYYYFTTKG